MTTMADLDALESLGWDTNDERVPVPAEHAPRKEAEQTGIGFKVSERDNPRAWISAFDPVEIRI